MHFLRENIRKDYEKGIEEIKKASKIKGLVIFVLGMVMSWFIHFMIYNIHPSYFNGQRLEDYFIVQISKEFGFNQREKINLQNVSRVNNGILDESDTLFVTGKYENQYTFIAILNKGNRRFSDFIFSTDSEYKIVGKFYSEDVSNYELIFSDFKSIDLDGDEQDEVVINLYSEYASYTPKYTLVFKGQENTWDLLEPDLSVLEQEILRSSEEYDFFLHSNTIIVDDKETKEIYGLSNGGDLEFYSNTFYNYYDFFYRVSLIKPGQCMPDIDTFAYLMLRIDSKTNELVVEENWNQGKMKISEFLLEDEVRADMGLKTDKHIFYNPILR